MKFFKTVNEKIKDLGFKIVRENNNIVSYERMNTQYNYIQCVDICHKKSGRHIIQSYDKNLFDTKHIGNTCVGLTYTEIKLFLKKMKQKGWKS